MSVAGAGLVLSGGRILTADVRRPQAEAVAVRDGRIVAGRPPTRWDLDKVTTEHPVVILHVSGHYALVNTRALQARGIGDDVRDPAGGSFERDEAGRPTGLLRDTATNLVLQLSVDIGSHGPNFHTALALD